MFDSVIACPMFVARDCFDNNDDIITTQDATKADIIYA
jgi:hypothetical protein